MTIVWHYTTSERLAGILAGGAIEPATEGVETRERPAVWFSAHLTWEPTATKAVRDTVTGARRRLTHDEMVKLGLVRIGIDAARCTTWVQHRKEGGISSAEAKHLVKKGRKMGADPGHWHVHYGAVTCDKWITVQRWENGAWADIS